MMSVSTLGAVFALIAVGMTCLWLRERKRMHVMAERAERAENAQREHTARDGATDAFISTVTHEMRTPLTSIRGSLGLLSHGLVGENSPKAQSMLRIAVNNTDRLLHLVNDILDLERMRSGHAPLRLRPCTLAAETQHAIDTVLPLAENASIHISFLSAPADTTIKADPDRIGQVLTNLLANAIKFSPPQSKIEVSVMPGIRALQVRVKDEGRGIPAEKLEVIFDRFSQIDDNDAHVKGGSGLGLAIAREIAQHHGGRLWAERNAVIGTTFILELPQP